MKLKERKTKTNKQTKNRLNPWNSQKINKKKNETKTKEYK